MLRSLRLPPESDVLARRLRQRNPVTAPGLSREKFNYFGATIQVPNCYSYAMGDASQMLPPGWFAHRRGDPRASSTGDSAAERYRLFLLDGLVPLVTSDLDRLPPSTWVVSLHLQRAGRFHLRRLDSTGWSEKWGDQPVQTVTPRTWRSLLLARSPDGPRYDFAGFYRVDPEFLPAG